MAQCVVSPAVVDINSICARGRSGLILWLCQSEWQGCISAEKGRDVAILHQAHGSAHWEAVAEWRHAWIWSSVTNGTGDMGPGNLCGQARVASDHVVQQWLALCRRAMPVDLSTWLCDYWPSAWDNIGIDEDGAIRGLGWHPMWKMAYASPWRVRRIAGQIAVSLRVDGQYSCDVINGGTAAVASCRRWCLSVRGDTTTTHADNGTCCFI